MTKLTDSAPNNIAADLLAQDTICLDPGIDLGSLDWMQSGADATFSSMDFGAISSVDLNSISLTSTNAINVGAVGTGMPHSIGTGTSINWPNTIWTTNTTASPVTMNQAGKISLQGDDADIEINGQSLMKMLQSLQHRLGWLQPNAQLEAEWDELRALGERYRELEKICEEKSKAWQCLKNLPPPVIP